MENVNEYTDTIISMDDFTSELIAENERLRAQVGELAETVQLQDTALSWFETEEKSDKGKIAILEAALTAGAERIERLKGSLRRIQEFVGVEERHSDTDLTQINVSPAMEIARVVSGETLSASERLALYVSEAAE